MFGADEIRAGFPVRPLSAAVIAFVLCTALPACFSQIAGADGPIDRSDLPIKVTKLRGSVHLVEDYNFWKTNTVMFADPAGIVFIDGTWTTKTARQILWKGAVLSEAEYLGVVVTAFPLYRTGGLWEFHEKQIPIYMHKFTPILLRQHWRRMERDMAGAFSAWRPSPPQAPDYVFDADLKFLEGRVTVLYPGPAHTPDNCVVFFPREKILYGGSMIAWPPHFVKYARPAAYGEALEKIRALDFDMVIAGHGKAVHGRGILDRLDRHMRQRALDRPLLPEGGQSAGEKK